MERYRVVTAESAGFLEREVQSYLGMGWKLAGGVATAQRGAGHIVFAQAITYNPGPYEEED